MIATVSIHLDDDDTMTYRLDDGGAVLWLGGADGPGLFAGEAGLRRLAEVATQAADDAHDARVYNQGKAVVA